MSGIESIIARSRMAGGFSERKRFTVARRRGIEKMRRFALVDPHYYVLELVQAAIANGAEYVSLQVERDSARLSYIGGGLTEPELAQLFDFLFASKDRADIGHVRELALGINAALLFEPERVVVESGDGTLGGSTRMVVHGDHDEVEVGRPERPLAGTFVAIEGLQRGRLRGRFNVSFGEWPREYQAIEERCLAAPVPIIVGNRPLFGWSSQRSPGLFGYQQVLAFDEGDLYGALGIRPSFGNPDFRLLTYGVAIASKQKVLVSGHQIGGIVCFDRLHKTVDHSGIVEDERLEEMWARLLPYAQQLVAGRTDASPYGVTMLGQATPLAPMQLRAIVRGTERVVVTPPGITADSPQGRRAAAIARQLDAVALSGPRAQLPVLSVLAEGELEVVQPALDDDVDVTLYSRPREEPPPRPWLASPVTAPAMAANVLAGRLVANAMLREDTEEERVRALADSLGWSDFSSTVYTPASHGTEAEGLEVHVRSTGRLVWRGHVASAHPGHVLVVDTPDSPPSVLRAPIDAAPAAPCVAEEVARVMADHATGALSDAFARAVTELGRTSALEPGSAAASLGLAAAARSTVARLHSGDDGPPLDIFSLGTAPTDVLSLPLLRTLAGARQSLHELAAAAEHGLVYGVIPEVPADLDGLDPSRILQLTARDERLLVELVGEAAYVRVDARDLLAEHRGVLVRDVALGLHAYPDFPLLIEGVDPSGWPPAEQRVCVEALVQQLIERFVGRVPPHPHDAEEVPGWEECRRHACRHLQWAALHLGDDAPDALLELPLFRDADGGAHDLRDLASVVDGLPLLYGHGLGGSELGQLVAATDPQGPGKAADPPGLLLADPFLYRLLGHLGARPAIDATLAETGARGDEAQMLAVAKVADPPLEGQVGIPRTPASGGVIVVLPDGRRSRAWEIARRYGIVGVVRVTGRWDARTYERFVAGLENAGQQTLRALLERARQREPDAAELRRIASVLLEYAARCLVLQATPDGGVEPTVASELAQEILGLPIFASRFGGPVPAWRLVRRFVGLVALGDEDPRAPVLEELAPDLAPYLRDWVQRTLSPANIVRPAARPRTAPVAPPPPVPTSTEDLEGLARAVEHWLAALRPDPLPPVSVYVQYRGLKEPGFVGGAEQVRINADHWLAQWARAEIADAEVLAWLLLAVYAYLNEVLLPVTNEHERKFQIRVYEALERGELRLRPREDR